MNTVRFNITLPKEIGRRLDQMPNKSAFIAKALQEAWDKETREKKRAELKAAYKRASQEERILVQEWDDVSGDSL